MPSKILVVEVEEAVINVLQRRIIKEGYECQVVRNSREALITMREVKPDLVLLEIGMPKMSGFEVMEKMGQDKNLKNIPVIVISNAGSEYELQEAEKLGAKGWIIKTEFDPQAIIDKIKEQISK